VKFKLDENLGHSCEAILRATGYDVATVVSQNLQGTDDVSLFNICATEDRVLVTLDRGFGRLLRFPTTASAGVVILESGPRATLDAINSRMREFVTAMKTNSPVGSLWIVEPSRVRIHLRE